ncbi:hypothetical protein [Borreliella garinii]
MCLFFGCLEAHRFYVGEIGTSFLYCIYRWLVIECGFH